MFQTGYSLHRLSSVLTAVAFHRFSEGPVALQRLGTEIRSDTWKDQNPLEFLTLVTLLPVWVFLGPEEPRGVRRVG